MKPLTLIAPFLLAASLTTVSLATAQQSAPPAPHGERGMPGPDRDDGPGHGKEPRGPRLTEAQQDKLFALRHAAEPARREREKAMRHAHEALRDLADSGHFDEAKAAALAQTIGQAAAADALDHARDQAQFLALLTPEQRASMQEERSQHGPGKRP